MRRCRRREKKLPTGFTTFRRACIAEREGAVPGEVAPVEMLRAARHATKASGQPDWAARLSAVRALVALPPEEDQPETAPAADFGKELSSRPGRRRPLVVEIQRSSLCWPMR